MKNFTLKQHWTVAVVFMGSGVAVSTIDILSNPLSMRVWPFAIAFALVTIGYLYHRKFVRCPFCGAVLPSTMKFPDKCEKCQESLYDYSK